MDIKQIRIDMDNGTLLGRETIKELVAYAENATEEYLSACLCVADMHSAAVGRVGGANRGVVEDVVDLRTERDQLLTALRGMHAAVDVLLARLIEADNTFYPTKSIIWPDVEASSALLKNVDSPSFAGHAARDVLAERRRQQAVEGWTPEHDDEHATGDMARAAAAYAIVGSSDRRTVTDDGSTPSVIERLWPWDWSWFKASGRRRSLVKAGALIVAEIERIDRAARKGAPS